MLVNMHKCHIYRIVIPVVVGSSPIIHPNKFKHLGQLLQAGLFAFLSRVATVCNVARFLPFFAGYLAPRQHHSISFSLSGT